MQFKKLLKTGLFIIVGLIFSNCTDKYSNNKDYAALVNPFVGTGEDGHTYPGAVLPFGMVQLSPDTRRNSDDGEYRASSGYHYSDNSILGFSHQRYSGTGRGSGGDFLFMPITGKIQLKPGSKEDTSTGYRSSFTHKNEFASPGYYKVLLDDYNIEAELTTTKRVGLHQYTFPKSEEAAVILDLEHGIDDKAEELVLKIINNNKIVGYRTSIGGLRRYQTIYFAAEFSEPFISHGMLIDGKLTNEQKSGLGKRIQAYFKFSNSDKPLLLKVAISKVAINGAKKNLSEINGWDFEAVKNQAEETWNKALNKIEISTDNLDQKIMFYTAMYHTFIHPSLNMDIDGRYRSANNQIYTASNFVNYTNFSLWDTFRAVHPLQTILNPSLVNDFINTFLERYKNSGNLPIFELSGNKIHSMIGFHSLSVITDAYVKNIRNYDIKLAKNAMMDLANLPWEKRNMFKTFGFVPYDYSVQSVSRTLEYSYDDWCVAQVLKGSDSVGYEYYSNRGNFYKNTFSSKTGFMTPKNSQFKWIDTLDPTESSRDYTQANAYQYTSFVPQDIHGLIDLLGGNKNFVTWLDNFFTEKNNSVNENLGQYNHGNEPSHHTAYLYNYAGIPWKTQKKVRQILESQYSTGSDGLSGNDDAGQMSAWYVFSALGFYPVTPGMGYYVIGSPLFDAATIVLNNGNKFTIETQNNSTQNIYIQSVTLNGKPFTKSYLKHSTILNGGKLIFKMGETPNKNWATTKEDIPFSIEFNAPLMPIIQVDNKSIPPDGVITFENSCKVNISTSEKKVDIYYTLDGSKPNTSSIIYKGPLNINTSVTVKAMAHQNGLRNSYTTLLQFRKLDLNPSSEIKNLKSGLRYNYRKLWQCIKVDDMNRYDVVNEGVVDAVQSDLGFDLPENNGITFNGFIKIPKSGIYTFYLKSDDGSRLSINDITIVNNDGSHRPRERSGKIALQKGFHKIEAKHFQGGGKPLVELRWVGPQIKKQLIPKSIYYHEK